MIAPWLTADEDLDDAALELALRKVLDPAGQRTTRLASACPECGQLPGPNLVLAGWHPCRCGGHATTYCRTDNGGCGGRGGRGSRGAGGPADTVAGEPRCGLVQAVAPADAEEHLDELRAMLPSPRPAL